MRKEVHSASLAAEDIAMLHLIAKREYGGNKSAALRDIIKRAARERGVVISEPAATIAPRPEVQYVA